MFKVKHKSDGKYFIVYHVRVTSNGNIHFIVFDNGHWYEWNAEEFIPVAIEEY